MEYTLERFELDMRKVDLYVENAVAAFNITVDEASLYSESTEYDLIVTEASDGLGAKIKAAFDKIIESIKKFFTNLIEKVKSIFTKDTEGKIKKIIATDPATGKQKIEIVDIKSIQDYCGKRKILCSKLVKKFEAGTLTQDEFDKTVQQMDALKQKSKTVGKVAATVAAALAVIGGGAAIISHLKKTGGDDIGVVKKIKQKYNDAVAVKLAQLEAETSTDSAQEETKAKTSILKTAWNAIRHPIDSRVTKAAAAQYETNRRNKMGAQLTDKLMAGYGRSTGTPIGNAKLTDITAERKAAEERDARLNAENIRYYHSQDSADDLLDLDLSDTFFDI